MSSLKQDLSKLETVLGYSFKNKSLLEEAITHKSAHDYKLYPDMTYQRLEFLGDRVLGLVVADMLFDAFPEAAEGELAKRFNMLVRAETCADIIRELNIGGYLRLSNSEMQTGGHKKKALLADMCEALLGALYRDGGEMAARVFIISRWQPRMMNMPETVLMDAKTALQEWNQAYGRSAPNYTIIKREGLDHAPIFTVQVSVGKEFEPAQASGNSKRDAEQKAAEIFLLREAIWVKQET